jgi:hypothetical protein
MCRDVFLVIALGACAPPSAPSVTRPPSDSPAPSATAAAPSASRDAAPVATKPEVSYDASATTSVSDHYAADLAEFFRSRLSKAPRAACVTFRLNVDRTMHVWHVGQTPVQRSGDDAFDAAVHALFEKIMDDRVPLPEPPSEIADLYRGRTIDVRVGDACR